VVDKQVVGSYPSLALVRAVRRDRDAIAVHEAAAARHEQTAVAVERCAAVFDDDRVREAALQLAARCRERADAARYRAEAVKTRLRSAGIDPD
jgi:hypothetical protein